MRRLLLAALLLVAWIVRLREPLSSPILGAEDPFLHMAQTWDVLQGRGLPAGYPPGFPILLAPFALLGPTVFAFVARWGPPLFGVAEVLGVFLLARRALGFAPALAAGLVAALMPENVFRSNLLFPTALDLALLPFVFLAVLRASEGSRAHLVLAGGLLALLLVTHPWVVALLVPTLALFTLALVAKRQRARAVPLAAATATGGVALVVALAFLPGTWNPAPAFFAHAGPRLVQLVANPASIAPLPRFVNLPAMLTIPAMVLAAAGAVRALVVRSRFALLALLWTALLLPFVLVDWFDVWFLPHRTVAYLSVGVALLAGLAVEGLLAAAPVRSVRVGAAVLACGLVVLLMLPSALAVDPWYRVVDRDDAAAWKALDARDAPFVVTTSWQEASAYRAMTGRDAVFNPQFFHDGATRDRDARDHPGLVVVVDAHAKENGLPTGFLGSWKKIGQWGDVAAYAR